jgi:hypothetical protein
MKSNASEKNNLNIKCGERSQKIILSTGWRTSIARLSMNSADAGYNASFVELKEKRRTRILDQAFDKRPDEQPEFLL